MKSKPILFALVLVIAASLPLHAAKLVLVAGGGKGTNNVPARNAKLGGPFGVDFDGEGNMFIVEMTPGRLLKVDRQGMLELLAGNGTKGFSGDGGPASAAVFNGIHNLALAPGGEIYLADTWNNRVRIYDRKTKQVHTFAGTGRKGFAGDGGVASAAEFGNVYCVSLDPRAENLFIADLDNRRIRAIDLRRGVVRTVAGNGNKGVPKDGEPALEQPLVDPRAVIADGNGNVYLLERSGHALRVVDPAGKIRTLAGTGRAGSSGDGGPALAATLNGPKHLCFDQAGDLLIADTENHVIRRYVLSSKTIERIAGTGKKGARGLDGPPLEAELSQPHGVLVHSSGEIYISDSSNDRVVKIVP